MSFRFKQFSVDDSECPMKVGTDSVLLGAWANLPENGHILDIGTGCGLLALMAAQRSMAQITAIDINSQSVDQAKENFISSPWSNRLRALSESLQDFAMTTATTFNHIISNPPYFVNSVKAPDKSRSGARHNDELPFQVLASLSSKLLNSNGRFSLILPKTQADLFVKIAFGENLFLERQLIISPFQNRAANRILLEFSKKIHENVTIDTLFIRSNNSYADAYKQLTRDFYLNF
ncbi:MAG: methyltransferase [Lentimicrobium sp.]|nr:methyltransferase [Lentimicrobium sp.]